MKNFLKTCLVLGIGLLVVLLFLPVSSQAAADNEVTIKHFSFSLVINGDNAHEAIPIRQAKVKIYGVNSTTNESYLLKTTQTDSQGSVDNLELVADSNFDQIRFQYYFGNDDRGYLIDLSDYKYNANHTRTIPISRVISASRVSAVSGEHGSSEFYYHLAMLNSQYDAVYANQLGAIRAAAPYVDTSQTSLKPIDLIYDTALVQSGNSFNRSGKGDVNRSVICINTSNVSEWDMANAVTHE